MAERCERDLGQGLAHLVELQGSEDCRVHGGAPGNRGEPMIMARYSSIEVIYRARNRGRAKSVVDVDDRHAGGARVQHREERGDAAEAGAIPDTGRYRDDRCADEAADDARERAFHAGNDDDDARLVEAGALGEEPVDPRHADVVQPIDVVAHHIGRDRRFLCHWYVRSSRRRYQDHAFPTPCVDPALDDSGLCVEMGVRHDFRYFGERGGIRPGDKQAVSALNDGMGNAGDLIGGLALSENHFRESLTSGACVIDAGESQVFNGRARQIGQRKLLGIGGAELTGRHGVEDRAKRRLATLGARGTMRRRVVFWHGWLTLRRRAS